MLSFKRFTERICYTRQNIWYVKMPTIYSYTNQTSHSFVSMEATEFHDFFFYWNHLLKWERFSSCVELQIKYLFSNSYAKVILMLTDKKKYFACPELSRSSSSSLFRRMPYSKNRFPFCSNSFPRNIASAFASFSF